MVKEAFADWRDDNAPRLGAALAYYTVFSLAPLLVIAIAIAGLAFGHEAAQGRIVGRDPGPGRRGGRGGGAGHARERAQAGRRACWPTVIGMVTLLLGRERRVRRAARRAEHRVGSAGRSPAAASGALLRDRFLSFAMVLVLGFLLLVSLLISAAARLSDGFSSTRSASRPDHGPARGLNAVFSFGW